MVRYRAGVMSTPAHLLVRPPPYVRAFTFVWESWRALDARFLRSALAFAVALGVLHGASAAFVQINAAWWRSFLSEFTDTLVATVALVLCVTVAARIRTKRMSRWVPYILAACAAWVVNQAFMSFAVVPALVALADDWTQWPGLTMPTLQGIWIHWPRMLIFLSLAAVGFMFAHEARLRADALRNVQLERAKLARRTFESRLQAMRRGSSRNSCSTRSRTSRRCTRRMPTLPSGCSTISSCSCARPCPACTSRRRRSKPSSP
jgi:hypothetical protein